jgi:hypothetical protein
MICSAHDLLGIYFSIILMLVHNSEKFQQSSVIFAKSAVDTKIRQFFRYRALFLQTLYLVLFVIVIFRLINKNRIRTLQAFITLFWLQSGTFLHTFLCHTYYLDQPEVHLYTLIPAILKSICNNLIKLPDVTT